MRSGQDIAKWMPLEIEPFLSSPAVRAMKDFQRWWYMELLLRAWQNVDRPCHLLNDAQRLWMWAGAGSKKYFDRHSAIVISQFVQIDNGQWLSNIKQLEIYAQQLAKRAARQEAGRKGGERTASNAAALLHLGSSSISLSSSSTASTNKKLLSNQESLVEPRARAPTRVDAGSEDSMQRIRALGFRDSQAIAAENEFIQQLALGAEADELYSQLARIYQWTGRGTYAPKLQEVIRRWQEPQHLWERRNHGDNAQPGRLAKIHAMFAELMPGEDGGSLEDRSRGPASKK